MTPRAGEPQVLDILRKLLVVSADIYANSFIEQLVYVAVGIRDGENADGKTLLLLARGTVQLEFLNGKFVDGGHELDRFWRIKTRHLDPIAL
jgi:hypothetical protein